MKSKQNFYVYLRVLGFLKPHIKGIVFSLVLTLVFAAANAYLMPVIRDITNQVSNKNLYHFSNHILNAVGLIMVKTLSEYALIYLVSSISYKVLIQIRVEVVAHLQQLSLSFYSQNKTGDIISRVFSDVTSIQAIVKASFETLIPKFVAFVVIVVYLFYLNVSLSLILFLGIPVFVLVLGYFSNWSKQIYKRIQFTLGNITHLLQENIINMRLVQTYNLQEKVMDRFMKHHRHNYRVYMKEVLLRCKEEPTIIFIQAVIVLSIVWFGGLLVVNATLTGGQLLEYFTGIVLLAENMMGVTKGFTRVIQSLGAAERVFQVLDQPVLVQSPKSPVAMNSVMGAIDFCHIQFKYPQQLEPVFKDFDLSIRPGESLAVVGSSGAGKSTLVQLLLRFYDVSSGSIQIDSVDIRDLDLKVLRDTIGFVTQDVQLFRGTIFENVRLGKLDATLKEVESALKQAHAWEFVQQLPHGIFSSVGELGKNLSGGQAQRISIARAILKNPKILILDEATSNLDSHSEQMVSKACTELMRDRTSIVIAHRLSTILDADRIVVIEDGRIAQIGAHQELIAQEGVYKNLFNIQFVNSEIRD